MSSYSTTLPPEVIRLELPDGRATFNYSPCDTKVLRRLTELVRLSDGWDGQNSRAISGELFYFTIALLNALGERALAEVQLVPSGTGQLQLEWHTLQGDIELFIQKPFLVQGTFETVDGDSDEETFKTPDITKVLEWFDKVLINQDRFKDVA